ncbi:MAG TPA: exodeoxyribonuclease VII small subunit [Alphaproteobacteria bacterium]|nr:exodeoxyribonuclease VII small subunit [Alphaproteobacteria bacterium]
MAKTDSDISPDIAALSFEEALAELEKIVGDLERGKVKLDDAIAAYTRGAQLKKHCEAKLAAAKAKVEKIVVRQDGSLAAEETELN